jgi:glutamate-1-semialdehyde 2,1-aminomutase
VTGTAVGTSPADWIERAMDALPGGTSVTFRPPADMEVVIERGEGAEIFASDGRSWVDYVLGSGPMILGHAHPAVVEAVKKQADAGFTFYAINHLAVELAEEVNRAFACAEQTKFACSGGEATFYALRIARAATGREMIVKLEGAYHGSHDVAVMSMTPAPDAPLRAQPDSAGVPRAMKDLVEVAPFNSAEALEDALARNRGRVAAVLMEPFQRAIAPEPGYLERVREITRDHDVLLIFDEVVTGFRLAYGGAQEYYGVTPDLCTSGKILGGGFALSAVSGRADLMGLASMDSRDQRIFWNGTLNAAPVAAAAGLATLAELRNEGVYERLATVGRHMRDGLRGVLDRRGVTARVLGEGPMFYVEYTDEQITDYRGTARGNKDLLRRVGEGMIRRGFLVNATQRNYISAAHTDEQLDATIAAYDEALVAALASR